MSTLVKRPLSFIVTLVLKDDRQFIILDVHTLFTWVHSIDSLSRLELTFFDGSIVDVSFSKIRHFFVSPLHDGEVECFDIDGNDYSIREFADHIILG